MQNQGCETAMQAVYPAFDGFAAALPERRAAGAARPYQDTKRMLDIALSVLALIVLSPVLALATLAVALDSPGPVLFCQRRTGLNGRPFGIFKFRTMSVLEDGDEVTQAIEGDARVTRTGRFLRAASIDELPQLFNVLAGDMSLVGPRPHPVEMNIKGRMYHLIAPDYAARHRMKPGITGLAQISGFRGLVDTAGKAHGRLALDLRYIREWSVGMDLRILARTVAKGFFGSGAF